MPDYVQLLRQRATPTTEVSEFLAAETNQKGVEEFINTCHSPEDGRFCEKHGGSARTPTLEKATAAEVKQAKAQAKLKIQKAPVPSQTDVLKQRSAAARAKAEGKRPGGESRGNSADRSARAKRLFEEFRPPGADYAVCPVTGMKLHWSDDPAENQHQYPQLSQDRIFVGEQGGGYRHANLIPILLSANRARGDRPLRTENLN